MLLNDYKSSGLSKKVYRLNVISFQMLTLPSQNQNNTNKFKQCIDVIDLFVEINLFQYFEVSEYNRDQTKRHFKKNAHCNI